MRKRNAAGVPVSTPARGRPRSTTLDEVSRAALRRFASKGFEQTTLDDIASDVGVGRRTLFSYFASKNDMVWGDFGWVIARLDAAFDAADPATPLTAALRDAVIESNTYPDDQLDDLRLRLTLIFNTPALQAHSMLRYSEWRASVSRFAAGRLNCGASDFLPTALGHAALAASTVAFDHWVAYPGEKLIGLLHASYDLLADGFGRQVD